MRVAAQWGSEWRTQQGGFLKRWKNHLIAPNPGWLVTKKQKWRNNGAHLPSGVRTFYSWNYHNIRRWTILGSTFGVTAGGWEVPFGGSTVDAQDPKPLSCSPKGRLRKLRSRQPKLSNKPSQRRSGLAPNQLGVGGKYICTHKSEGDAKKVPWAQASPSVLEARTGSLSVIVHQSNGSIQ